MYMYTYILASISPAHAQPLAKEKFLYSPLLFHSCVYTVQNHGVLSLHDDQDYVGTEEQIKVGCPFCYSWQVSHVF